MGNRYNHDHGQHRNFKSDNLEVLRPSRLSAPFDLPELLLMNFGEAIDKSYCEYSKGALRVRWTKGQTLRVRE